MDTREMQYPFYERLLKAIKRQIREVQGPEPPSIHRYYRAYALEMERSRPKASTFEEALSGVSEADMILVGDFHTLDQAQKQFMKILQGLLFEGIRPVVCLEMVRARHDAALQRFLRGEADEGTFLQEIRYFEHWGFDYSHYRPLLEMLRDQAIPAHGIDGGRRLEDRDRFMAKRMGRLWKRAKGAPLVALIGDLHLCSTHLPSLLEAEGVSVAVILQNSETIQMRRMKRGMNPAGWWRFRRDRWLVNNTKPWVKMQTYLSWLEHGGEALCSLYGFCRIGDGDGEEVDLTETVFEYVKVLKDLFSLRLRSDDDFQVFTLNHLEFLEDPYFFREPGATYANYIREGRALFMVWHNTLYIPMLDVNRTVQEAAHFLMGKNLNVDIGRAAFYDRIHYYASGYLASKLVNPLRRTDMPDDMVRFLRGFPRFRTEKDKEYLGSLHAIYGIVLEFLDHLESGREIPSAYLYDLTKFDRKAHFALSETLGRMMGERTYRLYDAGQLSGWDLRSYVFLQNNAFLYLKGKAGEPGS